MRLLNDPGFIWAAALALTGLVFTGYFVHFRSRATLSRARKSEARALGIDRPVAQYPFVDAGRCIGCGSCVAACPEGDVLAVVGGTAVVVNGLRCIGHGLCEAACPVGAIEVGLGDLRSRSDVPWLNQDQETTVPRIFIAGELGGLALVRNAVVQGRTATEHIADSLADAGRSAELDLVIVGAGPAGLAAGLTAAQRGLRFVIVEREKSLGGSILHYPRRKMVLTRPVELPPWGTLSGGEHQKEDLLALFERLARESDLEIQFGHSLVSVEPKGDHLRVHVGESWLSSSHVLLAIGRRGTPRKLGVSGEELAKVTYQLIDAASYEGERLLVVGGGDSAVEAAIGLAQNGRNRVSLSYRREKLVRVKRRNLDQVNRLLATGAIEGLFSSEVERISEENVRLRLADGSYRDLPNDYVFIFAGGVPPFGLLRSIGVRMGNEVEEPTGERLAASALWA